jgi:glycosyltransferase involved in cell wall biosynthesis
MARILQLINKMPYPAKDGGCIASLGMAKGFLSQGYKIDIIAMDTLKHPYHENKINEITSSELNIYPVKVEARISPVHLLINLLFSKMPYNAVRFINNNFKKAIIEKLSANKYDFILLEGLYLVPYIKTIRENSNSKIILRSHNVEHEIWNRNAEQEDSKLKKMYFSIIANRIKRMEISTLNSYDFLVPITKRDQIIFENKGNKKPSFVCPAGISMDNISDHPIKPEFPSLFHLGSLDWVPNQEGLMWFIDKVWPTVTKMFPNLKFHIAGRNAPKWLEDKLNSCNVIYHGEVESAVDFLNQYSVMIVPLFAGSGMRVKIIEGFSHRKTIITTSIGAEGINIQHGKELFIANSANEFIDSISQLIQDEELCIKTAENGFLFVKNNYDNNAIVSKLLSFIESIK